MILIVFVFVENKEEKLEDGSTVVKVVDPYSYQGCLNNPMPVLMQYFNGLGDLPQVCRYVLLANGAQTLSEGVFRVARQFINEFRSKLGPDVVESLILTKSYKLL